MATGTVKWFNAAKGYGFIIDDSDGRDAFVHHTGIRMEGYRTLEEGAKVEFDLRETERGQCAVDVTAL